MQYVSQRHNDYPPRLRYFQATVDALHRTLKQYCRADMQRNRLRDKYSVWLMTNTISPNLGIEFLDVRQRSSVKTANVLSFMWFFLTDRESAWPYAKYCRLF